MLFEPEERVRIQELCPADRIDNYRIIDQIVIEDDTVPHRFSNDAIPINENLTCIIGLKSTGKSILLQNIAQAIDPTEVTTRFNTVYAGKRIPFEFPIKVYWKDGTVSSKDSKDDKKIVYIDTQGEIFTFVRTFASSDSLFIILNPKPFVKWNFRFSEHFFRPAARAARRGRSGIPSGKTDS